VNNISDKNGFIIYEFDIKIYEEENITTIDNGIITIDNTGNVGSSPSISITCTDEVVVNYSNPKIKINSGSYILLPYSTLQRNDVIEIDSVNRYFQKNSTKNYAFTSFPFIDTNNTFIFEFAYDGAINFPISIEYLSYNSTYKLFDFKSNFNLQKTCQKQELTRKYYDILSKNKKSAIDVKLSLTRLFLNDNIKSYINNDKTYHIEIIGNNEINTISYILGNCKFTSYYLNDQDENLLTEKLDITGILISSGDIE
jgi:hypothetical protein